MQFAISHLIPRHAFKSALSSAIRLLPNRFNLKKTAIEGAQNSQKKADGETPKYKQLYSRETLA